MLLPWVKHIKLLKQMFGMNDSVSVIELPIVTKPAPEPVALAVAETIVVAVAVVAAVVVAAVGW